jgi:hypothetical protein
MKCPRRSEIGGSVFKLPDEDTWGDDDTCSYCGSTNPDLFMSMCEAGVKLGATDKSYKVYIEGAKFRKFYFMHLSEEQMRRFVDLYNEKPSKIDVDDGRGFYVMPFFMQRKT